MNLVHVVDYNAFNPPSFTQNEHTTLSPRTRVKITLVFRIYFQPTNALNTLNTRNITIRSYNYRIVMMLSTFFGISVMPRYPISPRIALMKYYRCQLCLNVVNFEKDKLIERLYSLLHCQNLSDILLLTRKYISL